MTKWTSERERSRPAVFLDRDGVVIENLPLYVRSVADIEVLHGAHAAIVRLTLERPEYAIVIVTNQSAIGRGIINFETADEINQHVVGDIVRSGGRVDGVFVCPHHPDDRCECRKPRPGLLIQARAALGLDLSRSIMIGDAISDIEAAAAAGVRGIMVRTGRGAGFAAEAQRRDDFLSVPIVEDLDAAVSLVLANWFAPDTRREV